MGAQIHTKSGDWVGMIKKIVKLPKISSGKLGYFLVTNHEEVKDRIALYRAEFKDFAEFLKQKYFK